jgi:twitching motility protein PilI
MTTRESLKEMQTRLAHRLQHAQSSTMVLTWLAVKAGAGNYLFPLRQSGEIVSTPQLCPVPRTKPWFLGVANVRGMLFGTIDLAHFLQYLDVHGDKSRAGSIGQASQAPSVVTLHSALEFNCAIQVDTLSGLRSKGSFVKSASPPAGSAGHFGHQFFDASECCWQEINLQALVQMPEFIDICA